MPDDHGHAEQRDASETFGQRLKRLRKCSGLSQAELGSAVGLRRGTISDYECGVTNPSRRSLSALALELRVHQTFLMHGNRPTDPVRSDACQRLNDPVIRSDGTIEIPLTRGKVALVDLDGYQLVRDRIWFAHFDKKRGYWHARTRDDGDTKIDMHRLLTGCAAGLLVDHKNHDTLDNRSSNLRMATTSQNGANRLPQTGGTSKFKGVSFSGGGGVWTAQIRSDGNRHSLGSFDTEEAAAQAYDDAARRLFGEFALTNEELGLF